MTDPYRRETIQGWVGDFLESPGTGMPSGLVREYAPEVLPAFLEAACDVRGVGPADVEEHDLKSALLDGVGALEIPPSVRKDVPLLCAAFLEALQDQGRLGGGRTLGLYVKALRPAYLEATSGRGKTIVAPAAKIGRNDPCPCGSGRKYKRCCQGRLDP